MLRQQDRVTDMAFCTNCGTNVGPSIRFCTNCGTPQAVSAPANAPLLEYGEQARAPQQPSINFSAPVIAPTSSTNKQFILMLCIAQIAAPLIYIFAHAIEYLSFEEAKSFYLPYLIASAISFLPFVVLAFIPKFQNDVQAKLFASVSAAVLGIQGLLYVTQGASWLSGLSKILFYLSMLASISGIALAVLLVLELKVNKSMLAEVSERWRAVPAFLAVLLLFLESPGLVIDDDKPFLSLILFPAMIGACLLQEKYRQGAAAGLGIVIIGSMVGRMAFKILSSYSDGSFISIPSFLALGCCLAVIAPNSIFQQKQTSVPR
jgi:hypothetical protein